MSAFTKAKISEVVRGYVHAATWTDLLRLPECPVCGEPLVDQSDASTSTMSSYPYTCANTACEEEGTHFCQDDFGSQETGSDPYEYGPESLTADGMAYVRAFVLAFLEACETDARSYVESDEIVAHVERHQEGTEHDQLGHDLYLAQSGSGVSFRDRFDYKHVPEFVDRLEAYAESVRETGGNFYLSTTGEVEVGAC